MLTRFTILVIVFTALALGLVPQGEAAAQTSYQLTEPLPLPAGFADPDDTATFSGPNLFPAYVNRLFMFLLAFAAISAVVMIVVWGITYAGSAGSESLMKTAKEGIWAAVFGLILALISVLLLGTINPDLVNLSIEIPPLK